MANRKPKVEKTEEGVRYRVYETKDAYEVLIGEGDIEDPDANVWEFPKLGDPDIWIAQAIMNEGNA